MHKNTLIPPAIGFKPKSTNINGLFVGVDGNYARLEIDRV